MKFLNSLVASVVLAGSALLAPEAHAQLAGPAGHTPSWVTVQTSDCGSTPQKFLVWTPVRGPDGKLPKPDGLLMGGRNITLGSTPGFGGLGPLGKFGRDPFTLFGSDSVDRRFPLRSYDGGQTFTRDPGAGTGRRDRA